MVDAIALGCGLVGKFVVEELANRGYSIHVVDLKIPLTIKQNQNVTWSEGDIFKLIETLPNSSLIINMLPGRIGQSMRSIFISSGKNIVDLAFTEQDPSMYDDLAKESESTVVWDVGVAPGLSNMILKKEFSKNKNIDQITIKVGGNPSKPDGNWSYMAPFSPSDVIEEDTRPARIIENNGITVVPALSDLHTINVDGYGVMEAFLTDGLRSLLISNFAPNMREYTIRWPGHVEKWLNSKDLISEEELIHEWKFDISKGEFTWMEIKLIYPDSKIVWIISDAGKDGHSSMARTTGLVTIACVIELLEHENGKLESGVFSPEQLGSDSIERVIQLLKQEGVEINRYIR